METLFDPESSAAFIRRIENVSLASQRQWGKMNVEEMLGHCNKGMDMMLGRLTIPRTMVGRLMGWLGKKLVIDSDKPISKNAPTDPRLLTPAAVVDEARVNDQKAALIAAVEEFQGRGPEGMPKEPHPFFGKLEPAEWDKLAAKHLDHHLRQFSA